MAPNIPIPATRRQPFSLRQTRGRTSQHALLKELSQRLFERFAHGQRGFADRHGRHVAGVYWPAANCEMALCKLHGAAHRGAGVDGAQRGIENFTCADSQLCESGSHSTVIKSCSARNRWSLMPRTMIKCSALRNAPYFSRCSTIRAASAWPMPGSFSNSPADAVLMLMREIDGILFWLRKSVCARFCSLKLRLTQPGNNKEPATINVKVSRFCGRDVPVKNIERSNLSDKPGRSAIFIVLHSGLDQQPPRRGI